MSGERVLVESLINTALEGPSTKELKALEKAKNLGKSNYHWHDCNFFEHEVTVEMKDVFNYLKEYYFSFHLV